MGSRPAATPPPRLLGVGLLLLAVLLAVNTVLGPLLSSAISYPLSETVRNETIGLEAISLLLVAPLAAICGVLVLRRVPAGAILAMGPAGYSAYMFAQYVAGPGYPTYQPSVLLHLAVFTLSVALLVLAWSAAGTGLVEWPTDRRRRVGGWVLVGLSVFVLSRWLGALAQLAEGGELEPAYAADPGMYWTIFLLDLGLVVPAALAAAVGLWRNRRWAVTALFGLVGWFALVPPSVLAMAVTKSVNDDPFAQPADTVVLAVATLAFWAIAGAVYRTLPAAALSAVPLPSTDTSDPIEKSGVRGTHGR